MKYKNYTIETGELGSFLVIKAVGQGAVPKGLKGIFTSRRMAEEAIDLHLSSLKKGTRKNAQKASAN